MARVRMVTERRLSYRDFLGFPNDGNRHELIDGVHYMTPTPSVRHQRIVGRLHARLWQHLEAHNSGEVFLAPLAGVFSLFDVVQPDLLYVSHARRSVINDRHVQGAPDLVIEVLSPSTRRRDEGLKKGLYDRAGVAEYWIVDPSAEAVRVYRRRAGRLDAVADITADSGQPLRSPLFPSLAMPIADLFGR